MRFLRFDADGPRDAVLLDHERLLDVAAAGREAGAAPWHAAEDRDLERVVRAKPPSHAVRRLDRARLLCPSEPARIVLRGGVTLDAAPRVVAPGEALPPGPWSTGVAAVLRPGPHRASRWQEGVAGFVPFHVVQGAPTVCFGPWIVGMDEVRDPLKLAFSAFVDDAPHIRPAKALLDWGATVAEAQETGALAAGDLVGVAAPARDVVIGERLRAALVVDGAVAARLEALVGG